MKTAVSQLQELGVKMGKTPEYECVGQTGPPHSVIFRYRCSLLGVTVFATARSKKEAKQEAARLCLAEMAWKGLPVTVPDGSGPSVDPGSVAPPPDDDAVPPYSYVALLKELCAQYRLPGAAYDLVADTGPAHERHFTVQAVVGAHRRDATATTKKAARQLAAMDLYTYLRDNLAKVTQDFAENDALVRAHEKAMDRYRELHDELPWRIDLGQSIADYPEGLNTHVELSKRERALATLDTWAKLPPLPGAGNDCSVDAVTAALTEMGLEPEWYELPSKNGSFSVLNVPHASPALSFCGGASAPTASGAARAAIKYLRLVLAHPKSDPVTLNKKM